MALEIASAGCSIRYCVETTAGTRPTTGYTPINNVKTIGALDAQPSTYDVTDLSDLEFKRAIPGLKDIGGDVPLTANLTAAFMTLRYCRTGIYVCRRCAEHTIQALLKN